MTLSQMNLASLNRTWTMAWGKLMTSLHHDVRFTDLLPRCWLTSLALSLFSFTFLHRLHSSYSKQATGSKNLRRKLIPETEMMRNFRKRYNAVFGNLKTEMKALDNSRKVKYTIRKSILCSSKLFSETAELPFRHSNFFCVAICS